MPINHEVERISCEETRVIRTQMVMPNDLNGYGILFGGQLLSWMDVTAGIATRRFVPKKAVTASFDDMVFHTPIQCNEIVTLESYVSGTGSRSLEVFVKVIAEDPNSQDRRLAATAFVTFVIPKNEENSPELPAVTPQTDEEKAICSGYHQRRQLRQANRANQKWLESIQLD